MNSNQYRYVLGSLFVTGAATLVLEIVGTRVISPYYGSSLYCWSALITVTLVSLAAGYTLGGRLSQETNLPLFARLISYAAAAVAIIPVVREPVLKLTSPLGVQWGAVASAALLIAPALILLSALGPLSIRLTTQAVSGVGKSAGDVYAVSTMGSVLGAALTGFWLIPHLAISHILYGLSILLLLIAAAGRTLCRTAVPWRELAAAAAVFFLGWRTSAKTGAFLLNMESHYGQIKVLDYAQNRYLLVNGTVQSVARIDGFESDSPYIHGLELTALLNPDAQRALVIGIGAGLLPAALEKHYGIVADTVDIDPAIVQTAKTFFNFSPKGDVFMEDGRVVLEKSRRRYGIVVIDAFSADAPPYHLFTAEAILAARRVLDPGGILAINLVSLVTSPGDEAWLSVYKTLRQSFPEVRATMTGPPHEGLANILFFCSDKPLAIKNVLPSARALISQDLTYLMTHELLPSQKSLADALSLSDDRAPLEFLMAKSAVQWRKSLQENLSEILLY